MIMQQTCGKCHGRIPTEECKPCNGTGGVKATRTITVTVPGGVADGNILRLEGMGNFVEVVNNFFNSGDAYTDAFVQLHVQPSEFKCTIKDNNLHVTLDITLLEALSGCSKSIKTLEGFKEIKIPPKTKNGHQVIIPNLGVSRTGNQTIDINVDYPQDIESLISHLISKEN
jgi:molecular chaperone DnaJ